MSDDGAPGDLDLRILQVAANPGEDGAYDLAIQTTRGDITAILHIVEGGTGAVVCVGGARGGLNGPARGLYRRLAGMLSAHRVSVLRVDYRRPNDLAECVLDTLAGCSFLRGIGAADIVLAGVSFGGAVVIKAAEIAPGIRGVVSLSPQVNGTANVDRIGCPLLLVHGTGDPILSYQASEDIFRRAADPRQIVLYDEADHSLDSARAELDALLAGWIPARLAGEPAVTSRSEVVPSPRPEP